MMTDYRERARRFANTKDHKIFELKKYEDLNIIFVIPLHPVVDLQVMKLPISLFSWL